MTRHFLISDSDGKNPRHVTLAEYLDAIDRGDNVRLELFESHINHAQPKVALNNVGSAVGAAILLTVDRYQSNGRFVEAPNGSADSVGLAPRPTGSPDRAHLLAPPAPASLSEAAQALADC